MTFTKTNNRQLRAKTKKCMRCGEPTLFTSQVIPGRVICPACDTALAAFKEPTKKRIKSRRRRIESNRNARGSNQYQTRVKIPWLLIAVTLLLGILLYLALEGVLSAPRLSDAPKAYANTFISPLPTHVVPANAVTATPTPSVKAPEGEDAPTEAEIEAYIKTIFGAEARTAIAISHHECSPSNAQYPKCRLHTEVEDSIGIFQVNLANAKQWIHAGRIPGKTMDEKRAWLENPFNNTLYAFWVYQTSGWNPWSAFTSGRYRADL